jgi:hypothetical protein
VPDELVGFGTLLQYQDPLTDDWMTVAGTKDLDFPDDVTGAIDVTSGTSGAYRKRIPSPLSSLEPVEYEFNFTWSQWKNIVNIKSAKRTLSWRLQLQNSEQTYMQFCGFISKLGVSVPMEELVMAKMELTPTGEPTWSKLN